MSSIKFGKIPALVFLFLLILNVFFVSNIGAILEDNTENLNEKIQGIENTKEKVESKWGYLGKEWPKIFLKNKIIAAIDSFLKKVSFIFVFLFGEPYSLSLTLFLVIILWIFLVLEISKVMSFTAFSKTTSLIIGFGLVIIAAQTHILRKIVESLGWFIFAQEAWWVRAILIAVVIVFLYISHNLISLFGKKIKETKEKLEKEKEKSERKTFRGFMEGFFKGFGKD